jgi:mono/diheme cytochrome c family protein
MFRVSASISIVIALFALLPAATAQAADAQRGRALYESRCDGCHNTGVHQRDSRKAQSYGAIREEVVRWNRSLNGAWTNEEIDDVTLYLNERFYSFDCPEAICGFKRSQAPAAADRALPTVRQARRAY